MKGYEDPKVQAALDSGRFSSTAPEIVASHVKDAKQKAEAKAKKKEATETKRQEILQELEEDYD